MSKTKSTSTRIMVTGEGCLVGHLRVPIATDQSRTQTEFRMGGASHLAWVLEQVLDRDSSKIDCTIDHDFSNSGEAMVVTWAPELEHAKQETGDASFVWRASRVIKTDTNLFEKPRRKKPLASSAPTPHVFVIEDLGNGFLHDPDAWPNSFSGLEKNWSGHVVLKTITPIEELVQSELWKYACTLNEAKLTLVVSAKYLTTHRDSRIRPDLSWDGVIEGLLKTFSSDRYENLGKVADRVLVLFPYCGVAIFERDTASKTLQLESLVYDRKSIGGIWRDKRNGITLGATSVLTGAYVYSLVKDNGASLPQVAAKSIAVMRHIQSAGGGRYSEDHFIPMASTLENSTGKALRSLNTVLMPADFVCTVPRRLERGVSVNLLHESLGSMTSQYAPAAIQIVKFGLDRAIRAAPVGVYGKYSTVDRDEVERLNEIRSLWRHYRDNPDDTRPLSIAVFGQPGAGKSFAMKELAQEVFGSRMEFLTFDLSQFDDFGELSDCMDRIGDVHVGGKLPVVLWDEFDGKDGNWLSRFLFPMQEGKFVRNGAFHPVGKSVWIFAGGTCEEFRDFTLGEGWEWGPEKRKSQKLPDFVSRLRGFVNLSGVNPPPIQSGEDGKHLLRRAILLRAYIEKYYPQLISPTGEAKISSAAIEAILHCGKFTHGARSIEAVISTSRIGNDVRFKSVHFPSPTLLDAHVSGDFASNEKRREDEQVDLTKEISTALYRKAADMSGSVGVDRIAVIPDLDIQRWNHHARVVLATLEHVGFEIRLKNPGVISASDIALDPLADELQRFWNLQAKLQLESSPAYSDKWVLENPLEVSSISLAKIEERHSLVDMRPPAKYAIPVL